LPTFQAAASATEVAEVVVAVAAVVPQEDEVPLEAVAEVESLA